MASARSAAATGAATGASRALSCSTIVSTTLEGPLDWVDGTVVSGDAVDVVARLKEESEVPLRSHGSLSMNRALMAAGLVDRLQVTLFPVITGQIGCDLRGCGRLRPRADRESNARRQHPRAHLPAHPACLSPSTQREFRGDGADPRSAWGSEAGDQHSRRSSETPALATRGCGRAPLPQRDPR